MGLATKSQVQIIHIELHNHKMKDSKEDIIKQYTEGRTTSSRQMSSAEASSLIGFLKSLDGTTDRSEKMRKKIISIAHEMNWRKEGTKKIDMGRVNNWCIKYGYLHKKLDDYTHNELPKLITQFEGVYKDFINKLK